MAKGDVIGRLPCVACGHECKVKEDVNSSPYWVCGECGCRVQVGRDPDAIAAVKRKMKTSPPALAPNPAPKPTDKVRHDEF
jgi:DNA-directed RNA polymerase subunit RPC12/RpoP